MRATFEAGRGFPLDQFQRDALDALDAGDSVLVAAPTGSGKTLVAEYAVERALAAGGKVFYTTPLKALSNQKYGDLARVHGPRTVGLLTGDNSVNGDAPIVVMTTEVLRNMIYAASPALEDLQYVVLDEVHYLQDRYRGPVWEEVIVHLPPEVTLVCLSATVSNAEEVAAWIETVRGSTAAIIEEHRPVTLEHRYLVGERGADQLHLLPTFVAGPDGELRPNPDAARLDARNARDPGWRGRPRTRLRTPSRVETAELLAAESMLPAIAFIFSRKGCDQAVEQCLAAGLRLTEPHERALIREIADAKTAGLADDDLDVLRYDQWLAGLEAGFAAHHAGMVPPMKEAVEEAFAGGLVKVVFATETLALGINMPARSVVIEKLSKFTGERHEFLTPGEYTQLTGRAGPARHRRAGLRHRVLEPVRALRPGGVVGVAAQRRAAVVVPADLQHGGQPRPPVHEVRGPSPAQPLVRAVPRRPRRRDPRAPARPHQAAGGAPARAHRTRRRAGRGVPRAGHRAGDAAPQRSVGRSAHHRGDGGAPTRRRRRGPPPRRARRGAEPRAPAGRREPPGRGHTGSRRRAPGPPGLRRAAPARRHHRSPDAVRAPQPGVPPPGRRSAAAGEAPRRRRTYAAARNGAGPSWRTPSPRTP